VPSAIAFRVVYNRTYAKTRRLSERRGAGLNNRRGPHLWRNSWCPERPRRILMRSRRVEPIDRHDRQRSRRCSKTATCLIEVGNSLTPTPSGGEGAGEQEASASSAMGGLRPVPRAPWRGSMARRHKTPTTRSKAWCARWLPRWEEWPLRHLTSPRWRWHCSARRCTTASNTGTEQILCEAYAPDEAFGRPQRPGDGRCLCGWEPTGGSSPPIW